MQKAEQLFAERSSALQSLKTDISTSLFDAIAVKLEFEKETLAAQARAEAKKEEKRKRDAAVLRAEFFIQKPLDANLI